jgi:hypothetical protein
VGLDAEKELRLTNIGLGKLFKNNRDHWLKMAQAAYDYIAPSVKAAKLPVRQDDVVKNLVSPLAIDTTLQDALVRNREKYWTTWFAELVVAYLWDDLTSTKAVT